MGNVTCHLCGKAGSRWTVFGSVMMPTLCNSCFRNMNRDLKQRLEQQIADMQASVSNSVGETTMKTYSMEYPSQIPSIVKALRWEGFRAWGEIENGVEVLCTDADITELQCWKACAKSRLLHDGLPSAHTTTGHPVF